ncbi:MAG: DUF3810 family protein [Gammaproteobacteria bacterium]|nr:DUF3810 family protein [Gammaproteobacteria bacterium]
MTKINIESAEIDLQPVDDDSTLFSDNEKIPIEHVNFEFEQVSKLRGIYRQLTVFNDTHCYQSIKNKHQRKYKYRLNLAYLDPRPFRSRHVAWRWLYASLALWGVDAALIFSGSLDSASVIVLGTLICSTAVALMTLMAFFYLTHDTVYFRSQFGKIRLMDLINNSPDNDSFRAFTNKLVMQINKSKTDSNNDNSQLLASELQQLRRLKDETVIDEDAYESAKRLIFKHDAFKAAG